MSGFADTNTHPTFSRRLDVDDVPPEGLDLTISATEPERLALAAEDGLEGLAKLEADLHVDPWRKGGLTVTGEVRARITQICVVTLDPFESELVEPIDVKFAPAPGSVAEVSLKGRQVRDPPRRRTAVPPPSPPAAHGLTLDAEDPPDPIFDGRIDLGALVAEFLALGLDPYPRKPGVAFEENPAADDDDKPESPFAKLEALKGALPPRR
jgi:uncharacterized metal-binding protein YceD (DUF177 family)